MSIEIGLEPGRSARALAWAAAALAAAHAATRVLVFEFGHPAGRRWLAFFDLGRENNLPSWFGGALLLFAAALLAVAAKGERDRRRPSAAWRALSGIFVFLAADELFSFHEALIGPVSSALKTDGLLRYAWVIPYGAFAAAVGCCCLGLLRRIPPLTRNRFIAAGAVYVAGALGCEMLGGLIEQRWGREGPLYAVEVFFEESLEMGGVILFIHALLAYLRDEQPGQAVRVSFPGKAPV